MPALPPVVSVHLDTPERTRTAVSALSAALADVCEVTDDSERPCRMRLVDAAAASAPEGGETVVAIGSTALGAAIERLTELGWLSHLVSTAAFNHPSLLDALITLVRRTLSDDPVSAAPFFGSNFRGRQATVRDSDARAERIESVCRLARDAGARESVVERICDVAEELITNALYDAPVHQRGAVERTQRQVLAREEACTLTYGATQHTFFLRATDPFGSLRRERMLGVLARCARGDAAIDASHGGAGLGMWRIFSAAELVLIKVVPQVSSEILVGLSLTRAMRATDEARSLHLFFTDPPAGTAP